jgi:hypothetical protein
MIIQNVSRKTHILSFLKRKSTDQSITLQSGMAIDLATRGFKDEELKNLPQMNILIASGEIKVLTVMPEITPQIIQQAEDAQTALDREKIIEKVKNCYAVTLIEFHARKARDNKDTELEQICKDRLNEIFGSGVPVN